EVPEDHKLQCAILMLTENAKRTEIFIQGLRSELQGLVYAHEPKTYATTLRVAMRIDADAQYGDG
ncbi:unnamed protein product, partial [Citrullus colocynthis]